MIAIDTNVLIRILVNDPTSEKQCQLARSLITAHDDVWICRIVLIETVWVLQSVYHFTKDQIISTVEKLIQHPHIHLEESEQINNALIIFSASNVDFSDCLILNEAQNKKLTLYTFDKKLSHLYGTKQVLVTD